MSTGTYRSLAAEVGVRRAAIYNEIRRCLRLRRQNKAFFNERTATIVHLCPEAFVPLDAYYG